MKRELEINKETKQSPIPNHDAKTITEYVFDFKDIVVSTTEFSRKIDECRSEILLAFMAKYGLQPDEVVQIIKVNKFWVEKKDPDEVIHRPLPFKCPNCEGSGKKETLLDAEGYSTSGVHHRTALMNCPSCQGTGIVWREE